MGKCVDRFVREAQEELLDMCQRYVKDFGDDLWQDICFDLLTRDKYEQLCQRGELRFYLIRVIRLAGFSKTTPFYRKYKKHHDHEQLGVEFLMRDQGEVDWVRDASQQQIVDDAMKKLDWFDAQVMRIYYLDGHTLKTLSHETGIGKSTLSIAIKRAKEGIQKEIQEQRARRHDSCGDESHGN